MQASPQCVAALRTEVDVKALLARALNDESGSTASEYAIIAVIMAVVIVTGARSVGEEVFDLYNFFSDQIVAAIQGSGTED